MRRYFLVEVESTGRFPIDDRKVLDTLHQEMAVTGVREVTQTEAERMNADTHPWRS